MRGRPFLVTLLIAVDGLEMPATAGMAAGVVRFLPNLVIAALVWMVGWLLANFMAQAVLIAAVNAQVALAPLIAGAAALTQLGIAREMVLLTFGIAFGGASWRSSWPSAWAARSWPARSWRAGCGSGTRTITTSPTCKAAGRACTSTTSLPSVGWNLSPQDAQGAQRGCRSPVPTPHIMRDWIRQVLEARFQTV